MNSVLSAFVEVHAALRLPKGHICIFLANKFSMDLQEARQKWTFVKKKMLSSKTPANLFGALSLFEKIAHQPLSGSPRMRSVDRRSAPPPASHLTTHPSTPVESNVGIYKRPKIRRLKRDLKNIRRRMEYRVHRPSSSERAHRTLVRKLWARRNAAALKRRRQFLKRYWRQHKSLRNHHR